MCVTAGLCAVSSDVSYGYHFVYEPKTMTEVQRYCRETYTDLATLHNMDDVKKLNEMATLSRMVYDQHSYVIIPLLSVFHMKTILNYCSKM